MPIARVQMPDGRVAKFEVPEGMKPADIEAQAMQQLGQQSPTSDMKNVLKPSAPAPKEETSAAGAFTRGAAKSALPAAAGLAAFAPGFAAGAAAGAPLAPVTGGASSVVGGVIGGLASSGLATTAVDYLQNKVLDLIPEDVKALVGMDKKTLEADAKGHPLAQFAGGLAPQLATMKPGGGIKAALAGAGLGAGIEAGKEVVSGEGLDPGKIALSAAAGGAMPRPNKLGEKLAPKFPQPTPDSTGPKPAASEKQFSEHLMEAAHTLDQRHEAAKMEIIQKINTPELAKKYQPVREELMYADTPGVKLSPAAQKMKAETLDPILKRTAELRDSIKAYGIHVGEDIDNYMPRMQATAKNQSIFESMGGALPRQKTGFGTAAGSLKDRVAVALDRVDPQGSLLDVPSRQIVTRDPNGMLKVWQDGKVVGSGKVSPEDWASGTFKFNGQLVKRGQASVREIEGHTPIRYIHDPLAVAVATQVKLEKVQHNLQFLEAMKMNPEAKSVMAAGKAAEEAPKDWKTVEGMPARFRDTKFSPRVAEALEDIIGKTPEGFMAQVGNVSRVITGSMFWNPMPHIFNVASHWLVEKGLVGGTVGLAKGAAKTLVEPSSNLTYRAIKAVMTQNEDYRRFLKEGAGMMSPGVFNKDFMGQVMQALGTKEEIRGVAKAWGYANPKAMIQGVYRASSKALWGVNDMMLMQSYLAKEASGMTAAKAIRDVERHIPNYQMPSRVMFDNRLGRAISKGLRDPAAIAFGRYEYGRMASYGHMVTDLLGKNASIKDRAHALDQMAMLYFTTAVAYPLIMDPLAQALTGNEKATAQRFGAQSIPFWIDQYLHKDEREFADTYGSKELQDVVQSTFLFSPATKLATEMATGTDTFTKKAASPEDLLLEHGLPPIKELADMMKGKKTVGQTLEKDFLGINDPTESQLRARDRFFIQKEKARLRKEKKRRSE